MAIAGPVYDQLNASNQWRIGRGENWGRYETQQDAAQAAWLNSLAEQAWSRRMQQMNTARLQQLDQQALLNQSWQRAFNERQLGEQAQDRNRYWDALTGAQAREDNAERTATSRSLAEADQQARALPLARPDLMARYQNLTAGEYDRLAAAAAAQNQGETEEFQAVENAAKLLNLPEPTAEELAEMEALQLRGFWGGRNVPGEQRVFKLAEKYVRPLGQPVAADPELALNQLRQAMTSELKRRRDAGTLLAKGLPSGALTFTEQGYRPAFAAPRRPLLGTNAPAARPLRPPATGVPPTYPNEAAAWAAGHQPGDRVRLPGVGLVELE